MKKSLLLLSILILGSAAVAEAQLREHLSGSSGYTGAVIKTNQSSAAAGNWMDALNMKMSHSYSMSFASVGGQYQNLNAYTNHLTFDMSDRLTGNVDVSFLHSPFGNSMMGGGNSSLGTKIIIDRAQLDYQLSPNSSLSIQFSQRPYYYPSPYLHHPGSISERNQFWY